MSFVLCPIGFPIVFPANASAPVVYAAGELSRYLQRMDGVEHNHKASFKGFCLRLSVEAKDLTDGAFRITISKDGILIEAGVPAGIVYGSYALLERFGCRFLACDCEIIPDSLQPLEEGVFEEHPAFAVRELFWREAMDGAFAVKLRLNSARSSITPEQGGKAMFYNFSHTFNTLIPVEKYFDSHPEYFSMIDGKRLRERTQLCLTNPDVLKLCVEGVKKWIRDNPEYTIFSVAMNDWYNVCRCPACRAIDDEEESGAGTMIRFVNVVADEVAKEVPHVMIHTFAYLYCRKPPKYTKPRSNVIIRLCSIECCFAHPIDSCGCETGPIDVQYASAKGFMGDPKAESSFLRDLRSWSKWCDHLYIWDYTTNYANYLQPFPNLSVLASNLRTFRAAGVHGVFEQGNFSHGRCSALGQLKVYLLGKLLWNPNLDTEKLEDEFVNGYYGPAAIPMREYVRLWHMENRAFHAGIYDPPDAAYFSDELVDKAWSLIKQALQLATENPYRERVEREALSIRYLLLARSDPNTEEHSRQVDEFAEDVRRLGITELFERKALDDSFEVLRTSRYVKDRSKVRAISYPI
ncbi:MAG: DUF4838 domain-containing protein [Clostridia bacterium]|nr:DUF4838 domain-containing protein [Clostridia bacterium]